MQTFDWGQFVASTVSVLLVLLGVWWWVRRHKAQVPAMNQAHRMAVVQALPLSLKHKMVLIEVDNQMVLTAVSPGEVKTLHAWAKAGASGDHGAA